MRIAIGSDHAGYELKCQLVNYLQHNNVEVHDMGTFNPLITQIMRCKYVKR